MTPIGETHTEDTLMKVYRALHNVGLDRQGVTDAVSAMQNAGVLFRERVPDCIHAGDGEHDCTDPTREAACKPLAEGDPWTPVVNQEGEHLPLKEIVGQAIGTASMCWANVSEAGEFDGTRAVWVADGLGLHIERALEDAERRGYTRACHEKPGHYCGRCSIPFQSADEALAHVAEVHPTAQQATTRQLLDELAQREMPVRSSSMVRTLSASLSLEDLNATRAGDAA